MSINFKDGHKIKFSRYGKIWLAESVIWEKTKLNGSLDKLRELKAKITQWFEENAPEEIKDRFTARLPLWAEINKLPLKDQIAYREGKTNQIADYFLGDENHTRPVNCYVGCSIGHFGGVYCDADYDWSYTSAVRLCLEER